MWCEASSRSSSLNPDLHDSCLMQEKYTFNIQSPRFSKKMILVKDEMETREHVVLKLLSYILFYDPRLKVEFSIGTHYKPDLVIEGDYGVPELWIDCGRVTLRKLESVASKFRRTKILIVKSEKGETLAMRKLALKKVEDLSHVQFVFFDAGFVAGIAECLGRNNDLVQWDVTEGCIAVALGDEVLESTVHIL